MDYRQPDFYHFSEDSLLLVKHASPFLPKEKIKLLDIGAGSGVLGIELANRCKEIVEIHFLEPQEAFYPYLKFNIENILMRDLKWSIYHNWLSDFKPDYFYDVIICNPPYFDASAGRKSPQSEKQICRSFEKDNPTIYLRRMYDLLHPSGMGFILIPDHLSHWKNVLVDFKDYLREIKKINSATIFLLSKEQIY